MKPNITFISASAGSGKTYRVTEVIEDRLVHRICRPGGLIATTFTVKAAQELRDRLRRRLHQHGRHVEAQRLGEALMGTVHGVCRQLLERFAFEAGISPRLAILEEQQAAELLSHATESVTDFTTLQRLQKIAWLLGQQDSKTKVFLWKHQVKSIIAETQANDISPEELPRMAERSVDELVAFLTPPAESDLDAELAVAIATAIDRITSSGDKSVGTRSYLELLRESRRQMDRGRLPWSMWVKLAKAQPTKASKPDAAPILACAAQFERHPRLRDNIREYTATLFALAQRTLVQFRHLKEERGLLDFGDLEQRALNLLRRNSSVKETLRQELDLLVVDEFQDTSPIQLALFMELADCARETLWVGDVKQAIYGFRNSDPALINAVVDAVKQLGRLADPLKDSYRSVPELVCLANALFTPPLIKSLGLPENQIKLHPKRVSIQPSQSVVEFLELSSGLTNSTNGNPKRLTNRQFAQTLAERVRHWFIAPKRLRVMDRQTGNLRPMELRDIAVLCRTNDDAAKMAECLSTRGLPVSLAQSGLLSTPEARLALACFRRFADPADTLATAEIIALQAARAPEQWLEERLEYVATLGVATDRWGLEEPFVHPIIQALEQARSGMAVLSPSEALDVALEAGEVFAGVSSWGPNTTRAAQRRANLESLRAIAQQYESACHKSVLPATIAGFLFWCDDLAASKADAKGSDDQINAIHLGTYHGAKGLEWPLVVCTGCDAEPRSRLWGLTVAAEDGSKAFDIANPLANRRLRFWAWPFGAQEQGIPLADRVEADPVGQEAACIASQEELRLLYVGLTRARDVLVIARDIARPTTWLDLLGAPWFRAADASLLVPDGTELLTSKITVRPPQQIDSPSPAPAYSWFPPAESRTPKAPARLTPSQQPPEQGATVGLLDEFGVRLPLTGRADEVDLGDALHAILAAELTHPAHPDRYATATRILRGFGLEFQVTAQDAIAMVDRFHERLHDEFRPELILVETPFDCINAQGQRLTGFIDLLAETESGWLIIDHKSFPGPRQHWEAEALCYSGQLRCYKHAVASTGRRVRGTWIHFTVGGALVEVLTLP